MRRMFVAFALWLGCSLNVPAQIMVMPKDPNYDAKVKLVDEFFERFNGKEITPYIDKKRADYRKLNLLSLFNIGMFKSKRDQLYLRADSLIDYILRDSIRINYADTLWFAKAKCLAKIDGRNTEIIVWLNVERRSADMWKWVIARAEGNALKMTPPETKREVMLLPTDHETNFISLHRMTNDTPKLASKFARKDFHLDETSVFFTLISLGKLKIDFVTDIEFVFFQVPGYRFYISYFEREKTNCGWLISSFERISEKDKEMFLRKMHE